MTTTKSGMTLDNYLNCLRDVKAVGINQWRAICPSHDDKEPSLSIKLADDGRVLFHCFAGCLYTDIYANIMAKLGVSTNGQQQRPDTADKGVIAEIYSYVNAQGQLLYEKIRYEPKRFIQRRPDGSGAGCGGPNCWD